MGRSVRRRKRKKWNTALPCFLFLAGFLLAVFPVLTNWNYQEEVRSEKEEFLEQTKRPADGEGRSFEELYQELRRRNERLYKEHQKDLTDPWSYEQTDIDLSMYGLDGNVIGFIRIPRMETELPILLGANTENMRLGAVHLTETSYPIGGENTNSVIAAHRGYSRAAMFRDIEKLKPGDSVYIENFREILTYTVKETSVIDPTDIDRLLIRGGKDMVTLITCHPYGSNEQRYVVYCERSSDSGYVK